MLSLFIVTGCSDTYIEDKSLNRLENSKKLVIGVNEDFFPMCYTDKTTGKMVGFDIDLAKEVCSRLNIELVIKNIEWEYKELKLSNGSIDCIWGGLSYSKEAGNQMLLTKPYIKSGQVIMVLKDSSYNLRENLKNCSVAVQANSSGTSALSANIDFKLSLNKIEETDTITQAVNMLDDYKFAAVILDEKTAQYFVSGNSDKYRIIQKNNENDFISQEEYVIAFRKNDEALQSKISETLRDISSDGKMAEISKKWFDEDLTVFK